jgi:hypothetical protein
MATTAKAEVPASAVIRRLNRQLERTGLSLKIGRGKVANQLGDYFLVSSERVAEPNVDLEQLAREHGCLEEWETVAV